MLNRLMRKKYFGGLKRSFTVYSNQHFRLEEQYGRHNFRYDANENEYSIPEKVYLQRRRIQKEEICKRNKKWNFLFFNFLLFFYYFLIFADF